MGSSVSATSLPIAYRLHAYGSTYIGTTKISDRYDESSSLDATGKDGAHLSWGVGCGYNGGVLFSGPRRLMTGHSSKR